MIAFDKQYKDIYNEYDKKLLALHKANFSALNNNMDYFITYLRCLRDAHLLNEAKVDTPEEVNVSTAALVTAVKEYESYKTCITKYYKLDGNTVKRITDDPEEEVAKKFDLERKFHWTNFWQLVMANIEDWGNNG